MGATGKREPHTWPRNRAGSRLWYHLGAIEGCSLIPAIPPLESAAASRTLTAELAPGGPDTQRPKPEHASTRARSRSLAAFLLSDRQRLSGIDPGGKRRARKGEGLGHPVSFMCHQLGGLSLR